MSRYSRRARAWVADETSWDDAPLVPGISVDDHQPVDTGLLWADGSAIWRDPNPMGFGKDDEW